MQALEKDPKLSVQATARIYKASETTLRRQRAGKPSQRDILASSRKLTDPEEGVLHKRILDLDSRGF